MERGRSRYQALVDTLVEFPPYFVASFVGVTLAILGVEFLSKRFQQFFANRSLESGLLSGFLLALLAAMFVEHALASHRRVKWDSVRIAAFEALAYQVKGVVDSLNVLATGSDYAATPHARYRSELASRSETCNGRAARGDASKIYVSSTEAGSRSGQRRWSLRASFRSCSGAWRNSIET